MYKHCTQYDDHIEVLFVKFTMTSTPMLNIQEQILAVTGISYTHAFTQPCYFDPLSRVTEGSTSFTQSHRLLVRASPKKSRTINRRKNKTSDSCVNRRYGFVEYLYLHVGVTTNKYKAESGDVDRGGWTIDYISTRACIIVHRIRKRSQGALSTI